MTWSKVEPRYLPNSSMSTSFISMSELQPLLGGTAGRFVGARGVGAGSGVGSLLAGLATSWEIIGQVFAEYSGVGGMYQGLAQNASLQQLMRMIEVDSQELASSFATAQTSIDGVIDTWAEAEAATAPDTILNRLETNLEALRRHFPGENVRHARIGNEVGNMRSIVDRLRDPNIFRTGEGAEVIGEGAEAASDLVNGLIDAGANAAVGGFAVGLGRVIMDSVGDIGAPRKRNNPPETDGDGDNAATKRSKQNNKNWFAIRRRNAMLARELSKVSTRPNSAGNDQQSAGEEAWDNLPVVMVTEDALYLPSEVETSQIIPIFYHFRKRDTSDKVFVYSH